MAAKQADHESVNAAVEVSNKSIQTMMAMMLEQQKLMTAMMENLKTSKNKSGGDRVPLTDAEKCPTCKKKAHKGGAEACWDNPKNANKHPKWYSEKLE